MWNTPQEHIQQHWESIPRCCHGSFAMNVGKFCLSLSGLMKEWIPQALKVNTYSSSSLFNLVTGEEKGEKKKIWSNRILRGKPKLHISGWELCCIWPKPYFFRTLYFQLLEHLLNRTIIKINFTWVTNIKEQDFIKYKNGPGWCS